MLFKEPYDRYICNKNKEMESMEYDPSFGNEMKIKEKDTSINELVKNLDIKSIDNNFVPIMKYSDITIHNLLLTFLKKHQKLKKKKPTLHGKLIADGWIKNKLISDYYMKNNIIIHKYKDRLIRKNKLKYHIQRITKQS